MKEGSSVVLNVCEVSSIVVLRTLGGGGKP